MSHNPAPGQELDFSKLYKKVKSTISEAAKEDLALYRAVASPNSFGVSINGEVVQGSIKLELVYVSGYDVLEEEILSMGNEANIAIPEGGFVAGTVYQAYTNVTGVEWESGQPDEWEICFSEWSHPIPEETVA